MLLVSTLAAGMFRGDSDGDNGVAVSSASPSSMIKGRALVFGNLSGGGSGVGPHIIKGLVPKPITLFTPRRLVTESYVPRAFASEAYRRPPGYGNKHRAALETELMKQRLLRHVVPKNQPNEDGRRIDVRQALDPSLFTRDTFYFAKGFEGPADDFDWHVKSHPVDPDLELPLIGVDGKTEIVFHPKVPCLQELLFWLQQCGVSALRRAPFGTRIGLPRHPGYPHVVEAR